MPPAPKTPSPQLKSVIPRKLARKTILAGSLLAALLAGPSIQAQATAVASDRRTAVGMVGHSLMNHDIPWILEQISKDKGKPIDAFEQIINGSPLGHNWRNHHDAEVGENGDYGDLHEALATRNPAFAHVILTERVAIAECIQWEDTLGYLVKWRNRAIRYNPEAQIYFYSTWVGFKGEGWWNDVPDDATWRARTLTDGQLFVSMAAQASADPRSAKGKPVRIVPGHRAMVLIFDELKAGKLPWLGDNIRAIFSDGIHLTTAGNYYIACVMYASIFNETPVGAAGKIRGRYGDLMIDLSPDQARAIQSLAWRSVCEP